jgi:hypothetical protein
MGFYQRLRILITLGSARPDHRAAKFHSLNGIPLLMGALERQIYLTLQKIGEFDSLGLQ